MTADFYPLLKNYSLHYLAPGARSLGFVDGKHQQRGGGVLSASTTCIVLDEARLEGEHVKD